MKNNNQAIIYLKFLLICNIRSYLCIMIGSVYTLQLCLARPDNPTNNMQVGYVQLVTNLFTNIIFPPTNSIMVLWVARSCQGLLEEATVCQRGSVRITTREFFLRCILVCYWIVLIGKKSDVRNKGKERRTTFLWKTVVNDVFQILCSHIPYECCQCNANHISPTEHRIYFRRTLSRVLLTDLRYLQSICI